MDNKNKSNNKKITEAKKAIETKITQLNTEIAQKKEEAAHLMTKEQLKKCLIVIYSAAGVSGAAGALPIPVADAVPISAAQITMAILLGKIFGQRLDKSAAMGLIGATGGTVVGRTLAKLLPFAGLALSAALAGGITESIGWALAITFAKASLGSDPEENKNTDGETDTPDKADSLEIPDAKRSVSDIVNNESYDLKTKVSLVLEHDKLGPNDRDAIYDLLNEIAEEYFETNDEQLIKYQNDLLDLLDPPTKKNNSF